MTAKDEILSKLENDYTKAREYLDLLEQQKEVVFQKAMKAVESEMVTLEADIETATATLQGISDEIKTQVLELGESVKGTKFQAVYVKGRESWDGKRLEGYAVVHPEILTLRKIGDPSVQFREVK